MNLSLSSEAQKLIEERVRSGKYASPEEVVLAALHALESDERGGDFKPGEWDELLAEGEQNGAPLDGESVLGDVHRVRRNL
jgi:antitoxin ParD1/3/4